MHISFLIDLVFNLVLSPMIMVGLDVMVGLGPPRSQSSYSNVHVQQELPARCKDFLVDIWVLLFCVSVLLALTCYLRCFWKQL